MNISTIGLDLAKNVFQVHGIDDTGKVTVRRSSCAVVRCCRSSANCNPV